MKKIYNIMMLLACLTLFWSCETDISDHPTAKTPTSFVLNTPPYISGVYDLKNTESILLTTTQPDYGFTAATTYRVQIALALPQFDSEEFAVLPTAYTTANMQVSATEMAVALVGLLGVDKEEDFPENDFPVFVRLSAEFSSDGSHQAFSNTIELPRVKSYFALDPVTMPENIYLIGNVTGWDWGTATAMVPVYGAPGKFWTVQYLGQVGDDKAEIKFNIKKAWDGNDFGMKTADIDDASKALAGISGDDNIIIGNPGWYIVVVATEIVGRDYVYHVQFLAPNVYLCGNVAGGLWGADGLLFTVPALSLGADASFVSPAFVGNAEGDSDGGVRACVVLSGQDWWHTEFMVFDGELKYRATGGDQARVPGAVGQILSINFTKGTGNIK